jgi:hypothetical protein
MDPSTPPSPPPQPKPRRPWAGPLGVLLLIALGIGLLAAGTEIALRLRAWNLGRGAYPEEWSLLEWRSRSGFETVHVAVAGRRLTLPKFFVTRADRGGLAGPEEEVRKVTLELRLPDFKPYGPRSAEDYAADRRDRIYIGLLTRAEATPPEEIVAAAVASGHRRHPNPVPDGKVHLAERSPHEDWAYAYTAEAGYRLFAICERGKVENGCDARFMAGPDIAVAYHFPRERYLDDWASIDAKVRALLRSFDLPLD